MILNLVILLLYTGTLVNSEIIVEPAEEYDRDENMLYGWDVNVLFNDGKYELCHGIFITPRVYITDPVCLRKMISRGNYSLIEIDKTINGTQSNSYNVSEIYYNEDLNVEFDPDGLKIAILITDEPVKSEDDKNGYVQLNSNLNDVNTTSCFIPSYFDPNISFTRCNFAYFDTRNGNPSNIYCFTEDVRYTSGDSFFCYLKSDPEVKVLVGIMSDVHNGIEWWGQSGLGTLTIPNLSGLNDTITKKMTTLL